MCYPFLSLSQHLTFNSIMAGPITTFLVGKDKKRFHIHTELVAIQSPALYILTKGPMQEGTTKVVIWDDTDPETVEQFVTWIYSGIFEIRRFIPSVSSSPKTYLNGDAFNARPYDVPESSSTANNRRLPVGYQNCNPIKALELCHGIDPAKDPNSTVRSTPTMLLAAAKLYVLAEKFDMRVLKLKATQEMSLLLLQYFDKNKTPRGGIRGLTEERAEFADLICYVWANTINEEFIRVMVVDFLVGDFGTFRGLGWCMELVVEIPDFGDDLLRGFLRTRQ